MARYAQLRSTGTRLEAQRHPRQATAMRPSRDPAELVPLVKAISSPVLAIVGRMDAALASSERLHELVPGAQLEVLEGNAHNESDEWRDVHPPAHGSVLTLRRGRGLTRLARR